MTFALAWGMAMSERFLGDVVEVVTGGRVTASDAIINLQRHDRPGGFTDVEIAVPRRLDSSDAADRRLVILTQWGAEEFVAQRLGDWELPYPRKALGWSQLVALARKASRQGAFAERRLLHELATYFASVSDMRDIDSNQAYVVSLSRGSIEGWPMSLVSVVADHGRYFFPVGRGGWPKIPPNYMAFRYDGRLQPVHHVDDYVIATEMTEFFPGVPASGWDPHFLLSLGPPIRPAAEIRNGPSVMRAMRIWVDIDLLLTSPTITDALTATKVRRSTDPAG